ncbi:MAG: GCN5-related N-acetyltransferase [uncultured bacterium]|nr:MAG: GCN5-related N-acetyltransferase [uncultured bacterium]
MIKIHQANMSDAESLSDFIKKLDTESCYLLYDSGERKNDVNTIKSYLSRIDQDGKSIVFIAENEHKEIIGFICGEVPHLKRLAHLMKCNIGILKKYHGAGIGSGLLEKLITYAKETNIIRLEATVIKQNTQSVSLCERFGFNIEGIKIHSIKINDELHDEYLLAKLITL